MNTHTYEAPAMAPLLKTREAAKLLGLSPRTLEGYRLRGDGPVYLKIRKSSVRYAPASLMEWANADQRSSTSETPNSK